MKKNIFLIMSSLLLCTYSVAQVTTLTFTAKDKNEFFLRFIRLDRMVIHNLTKNWTETIYYPDTVLIMGASGIEDVEDSSQFSLFRNVPNPFAGVSEFSIQLIESQKVTISVFDAEGRKITATEKSLLPGEHAFRLLLSTPQTYLLHVRAGTKQASLTVINTGNAGTNRIEYLQNSRSPLKISPLKTNRGETDNPFDLGDEMEYYGYAIINDTEFESEHIQQLQLTSESFELLFSVYAIPTVITAEISDITPTSATSGGDVISDGNDIVTARGVCWSTSPYPTITDFYMLNGTGIGTFTSVLTELSSNTTYYIRAFAINSFGTSYGANLRFTTPTLPCLPITDVDNNTYQVVQLGTQCWMKENLRVTKYSNSTIIPLGSSTSSTVAYRYNPNNDDSNISIYGYLYNWPAVMDGSLSSSANPSGIQGICPDGWHVPSDAEWIQLTDYVSIQSVYQCNSNSFYIAKSLASTTDWNSHTNICAVGNNPSSNNATGFGAVPAGRYFESYYGFGSYTFLWSVTEDGASNVWRHCLYSDRAGVSRNNDNKYDGFSVRCLRD